VESFKKVQQNKLPSPILSSSHNTKSILSNKTIEEKQDDNKVNVYNSCHRRNIKKIHTMMGVTKNMTQKKSIYTNFDYSDDEYSGMSSSSSSESSYTSCCEDTKNVSSERRNYHSSQVDAMKTDDQKMKIDDPMVLDNKGKGILNIYKYFYIF